MALLCGALIGTLALLAATLAGVADPRPLGTLTVQDTFADAARWRLTPTNSAVPPGSTANGYLEITARPGDPTLAGSWLGDIECPCTVELRAIQTRGSQDAAYGMWWIGASGRSVTRFGVNSDGYLAILPGDTPPIRDWQLFPHVRPLGQVNVFRADIDRGSVTVRLNDEVAAQLNVETPARISAGFFVAPSLSGDAVFRFLSFKTWETTGGTPEIKNGGSQ